jgi:hypothetical protein
LARDKFVMSLSMPPNRTRHMPGQLASGSIVAVTRAPSLRFRPSQTRSFLPKQCPNLGVRRNELRGPTGAFIGTPPVGVQQREVRLVARRSYGFRAGDRLAFLCCHGST